MTAPKQSQPSEGDGGEMTVLQHASMSDLAGFFDELSLMAESLVEIIDDTPSHDDRSEWRLKAAAALARQVGLATSLAAAAHGQKSARSDAEWWMPGAIGRLIHDASWRTADVAGAAQSKGSEAA